MMDKMKILYFMDGVGYVGGIQEMTLKWVGQFNPAEVQVDILSYDRTLRGTVTQIVSRTGVPCGAQEKHKECG